jgi:predicted transcriptional regulator
MTKTNVYIIVSIISEEDDFSVEPLGVYSDLNDALEWVTQLEANTMNNSSRSETMYDVLEFELDKKPFILDWLKKKKQVTLDSIEKTMIKLMKDGHVDQLIGEDGHFYYTLTESGKKIFKGIPSQVKKFFRKD